jgi:hypothetical protein
MLFFLLLISSCLAEDAPPPGLAHWEFLLTEVQKLSGHHPNEDPDLKVNDIIAPMTACHDKPDDMRTIADLVKIYEDGIAIGKRKGVWARVRYIKAQIDRIGDIKLANRLSLEGGALLKPETTLGSLRQSSCAILVQDLFISGASKELLLTLVQREIDRSKP